MKPGLVIGNGESRKLLNLNRTISNYTSYGCNAIVRDINVDYLVCVDRRMVKESLTSPNCPNQIHTRQDWKRYFTGDVVAVVPNLPYKGDKRWDDPFHWGSGPYALLLAASHNHQDISMIGFDLYSETKHVNNVYKDTPNYNPKQHRAIDPSYWIKQVAKVFECFPNTQFKVYNKKDWSMPISWKLDNVKFEDQENFNSG